jgi:hypothetical protein
MFVAERKKQMQKKTLCLMTLLGLVLLTAGCQTAQPTNAQLLQEDYALMADAELLSYYQQLTERIAAPSSGGGGFGFGLGIGVGLGSSSTVGLGASKGPEPDYTTEALLQRRDQVRLELARRGLEPAPSLPASP